MLLELGLPSFDSLLFSSRVRFEKQVQNSQNSIIAPLRLILLLLLTTEFYFFFLAVFVFVVWALLSEIK